MFNFFSKKPTGQKITLSIKGMHCAACAMNIDGALEETDGVLSTETSYAKARVKVDFDATKLSKEKLVSIIKEQGYDIQE